MFIPVLSAQELIYQEPFKVNYNGWEAGWNCQVVFNGVVIADTDDAKRVLETSHPPVYYVPPKDIQMRYLREEKGHSVCEWKGRATYYTLIVGSRRAQRAAWSYHDPNPSFSAITF